LKTILLFFIIPLSFLFASDTEWEALILEKMLESVSTKKSIVKVYTDDKILATELQKDKSFTVTDKCDECDFIVIKEPWKINGCNKPEIVFDYHSYKKTPDAIGVFFWQKGRPTIRFSAQRLGRFGLKVNGELKKFVSQKN